VCNTAISRGTARPLWHAQTSRHSYPQRLAPDLFLLESSRDPPTRRRLSKRAKPSHWIVVANAGASLLSLPRGCGPEVVKQRLVRASVATPRPPGATPTARPKLGREGAPSSPGTEGDLCDTRPTSSPVGRTAPAGHSYKAGDSNAVHASRFGTSLPPIWKILRGQRTWAFALAACVPEFREGLSVSFAKRCCGTAAGSLARAPQVIGVRGSGRLRPSVGRDEAATAARQVGSGRGRIGCRHRRSPCSRVRPTNASGPLLVTAIRPISRTPVIMRLQWPYSRPEGTRACCAEKTAGANRGLLPRTVIRYIRHTIQTG